MSLPDLEVYTLGIDHCPKSWVKDPHWSGATESGLKPSHEWENPSILKPAAGQPDKIKLIDYLVINRNPRNKLLFKRNARTASSAKPTPPPATSTRGPSISQLFVPPSPSAMDRSVKGSPASAKNTLDVPLGVPGGRNRR